jgi:hypothetical protein
MHKLFSGIAALVLAAALSACGGGNSGPTTIGAAHTITVDDTQGLATLIDAGHYDSVNDDIAANFALTGKGKHDESMVLVSFNRDISSEDADAGMRARGLRPANLDECLAYGAALAKARQDYDLAPPSYWIVCLGQSAQVVGDRDVPGLWSFGSDWCLDLSSAGMATGIPAFAFWPFATSP